MNKQVGKDASFKRIIPLQRHSFSLKSATKLTNEFLMIKIQCVFGSLQKVQHNNSPTDHYTLSLCAQTMIKMIIKLIKKIVSQGVQLHNG